jgi:hypothetical protein
MKVNLFGAKILTLGLLVFLTSCQGRNAELDPLANSESKNSETETSELSQKQVAAASQCESGQAPKILSGDCSGVWSVKQTNGVTTCEFEWKPTVTCPAGMKAMGLQSACYGVTSRPAEGNVKTSADCLAAHGKHPISPAYKLECCP